MKVNILNIIIYSITISLLIFLIIIYGQPFLLSLLLPFIFISIADIIIFSGRLKHCSARLFTKYPTVVKGNPANFYLDFNSKNFIDFYVCDVKFNVKNLFYDNNILHNMKLLHTPFSKPAVIPIENNKTGQIMITINITYHDFLGFLSYSSPETLSAGISVLPSMQKSQKVPEYPSSDSDEEYTEADNKGNVSSDVKEIRQYIPGDRLQRIHWKLSAKLEDVFVKEMAHTSSLSVVLLPEFTINEIDDTITNLIAVSKELLKEEKRFQICLFNDSSTEFTYYMVTNEEELINTVIYMFYMPLYLDKTHAADSYFASSQQKVAVVDICGNKLTVYDDNGVIC